MGRIRGDTLPAILLRTREVAEFARLEPGNCLSANYLFPTFYRRTKGSGPRECQVAIRTSYFVDPEHSRSAEFALSSGWAPIPQP